MEDTALRHAVAVATGSVIVPLASSEELIPQVMKLAREHGEQTVTIALEREKNRNLKRQVDQLQEMLRERKPIAG